LGARASEAALRKSEDDLNALAAGTGGGRVRGKVVAVDAMGMKAVKKRASGGKEARAGGRDVGELQMGFERDQAVREGLEMGRSGATKGTFVDASDPHESGAGGWGRTMHVQVVFF
jgi:hypothetical protein